MDPEGAGELKTSDPLHPLSFILHPSQVADEIDKLFSHLWMVRTFVKHAPEVEDFPELMQVVRAIFDASRAVETHRRDPTDFLRMVKKKRAKLKAAAEQFRKDAPLASDHTNFKMAVRSLDAALEALDRLLDSAAERSSSNE
jgi:aminodeoxyfutalosine deaminase